MVIPFSNTKLRVPKGFQTLLVGLSTEVLRSQPRNIHEFAADYFEKLVQRRDQGESYLPDKQTSLEDRYYNNPSFQEEYSVNDPEVHHAATRIQAKFRGHKARQDVEKMKQNKDTIDTDREELGVRHERSATPQDDDDQTPYDDHQKSSRVSSARSDKHQDKRITSPQSPKHEQKNGPSATSDKKTENLSKVEQEPDQPFDKLITEEERQEQERAARSIQARFRGHRVKKSAGQDRSSAGTLSDRDQGSDRLQQDSDNEKIPSRPSTHQSGKLDSDRHDIGDDNDTDRPDLKRERTQLSEDFERHTQAPRDAGLDNDEIDMNDPNLDKAATRIQASFRGYKTRKELGTGGGAHEHHPTATSSHAHDEYDHTHGKILSSSVEGNKEHDVDEDDNMAAIKIQAAYRGYRVRKDLEK